MVYFLLGVSVLSAAAITLLITPYFMRFLHNCGIVGVDQQKKGKPLVPSSGGMPVVFAFFFSMMFLIAFNSFVFHYDIDLNVLLAASLSSLAIAMVGFFDDLYLRRTKLVNASGAREYRVGLAQWQKPLLTLVAAVPLMAVEAGTTSMSVPFVGAVNFGILYPLLLVPLAVMVVSNATNMLAGVNGVEAGMVGVASLGVGAWALSNGSVEGAVIGLIGGAALLSFLVFNWYPARMLPGDSLTYFAGAVFVSAVVLGNVEKFGFYVFVPWIVEAFLKLRGKFAVRSYGNLRKDGTLEAPYPEVYSLTHLAMKLGDRLGQGWGEKRIAQALVLLEMLVVIAAFLLVPV